MQGEQQFCLSERRAESSASGVTPTLSETTSDKPLISVCAWCFPNLRGYQFTHGICRRHQRYELFKYRGRQPKVFKFKFYTK